MNNGGKVSKSSTANKVGWSSPSNIALVKYWGKRANQIPENPSISFSLSESRSFTEIEYSPSDEGFSWSFLFEGEASPSFEPKLSIFFDRIKDYVPSLSGLNLRISSRNSFPHSTGIASSASAMSALSLCLLEIESRESGLTNSSDEWLVKASEMSRLGSGSAARSVYPGFSVWGKSAFLPGSSDTYAIDFPLESGSFFNGLQDTILIASSEKKEVSSSQGHSMMDSNPYSASRYRHANENLGLLIAALGKEDKEAFISITENEALSLHGLMMSSSPGFILINGRTIEMIQRIRKFRKETGKFICFTLDAGPNIHLFYHEDDSIAVKEFIGNELRSLTEDQQIIWDKIGSGPQKIPSL